ncbi:hypothetical protein ON010_g14745 [Phytophthora cinnamomi]|nr:hypothetical protein ON010_g14745 [Phytophthora cinnamomi]
MTLGSHPVNQIGCVSCCALVDPLAPRPAQANGPHRGPRGAPAAVRGAADAAGLRLPARAGGRAVGVAGPGQRPAALRAVPVRGLPAGARVQAAAGRDAQAPDGRGAGREHRAVRAGLGLGALVRVVLPHVPAGQVRPQAARARARVPVQHAVHVGLAHLPPVRRLHGLDAGLHGPADAAGHQAHELRLQLLRRRRGPDLRAEGRRHVPRQEEGLRGPPEARHPRDPESARVLRLRLQLHHVPGRPGLRDPRVSGRH